jgi:hypothetical protein
MDNKAVPHHYPTPAEWTATETRTRDAFARYNAADNRNTTHLMKDFRDYAPRNPLGPRPTSPSPMTAQNSLGIHPPTTEPEITYTMPRFLQVNR